MAQIWPEPIHPAHLGWTHLLTNIECSHKQQYSVGWNYLNSLSWYSHYCFISSPQMLTWPNEVWECCDPLRLVVTLPATSPCAQRVMSCIKLSSVTDLSSPVRPNNSSELIRHEHNPGFLSFAGRENCLEDQVWVTVNASEPEHSRVIKWWRNQTKQTMENPTKSNMSCARGWNVIINCWVKSGYFTVCPQFGVKLGTWPGCGHTWAGRTK